MIKEINGDTFVSTENHKRRFDLGSTFYTLLSGNDMQQPRRVRWVDRIRSKWRYPCCNRVDQTKTSPYMQNFATIYALSCGEKLSPKVHLWRKNDKYQVCLCKHQLCDQQVFKVKCDIQKLVHLHDPAVRITLNGYNHGLLKVNTRSLPHLWVSLDFEA